ncbi:MAG TPA: translation initiation factor IF-2, partial [Pyrinomonadaceae bacterium]|nr:translation initiation factor IF-2 [Pyrinomonadaceae bacterium]
GPAHEPAEAPVSFDDGGAADLAAVAHDEQPAPPAHAEAPIAPSPTTTTAPPLPSSVPPPGRQVRVLRPTAAALNAGIQPGQRAPAPVAPVAPARPAPAGRPEGRGEQGRRRGRGGPEGAPQTAEEMRGTPGETATPQTIYRPPSDQRRPAGRGGRRGRPGPPERGGKRGFERDLVPAGRPLSLENRIAQSLNVEAAADAKKVHLVEGASVKEFAEKTGIRPKDIQALLLQRGVFATLNQPLDNDVAQEIGRRFGFDVQFLGFEEMVADEEITKLLGDEQNLEEYVEESRAPVVTVMGHVDHGKTSLLDAIRTTDVAAGEAGGITQHIGAYSVEVPSPDAPDHRRRVVFLDTPGHEAFTMMRARGAKATDIVVLVVAADDGVMPQTVEAIEHSRAAGVPIVVAINKIDKPDANPDRVKQELAGQGVQPVDWGGDIETVSVSAKRRENLDTLLETILLTADILNLKASPKRLASGVVLEAKLDRGRGAVATVLVQNGTLHIGDPFIVGQIFGKVRAMYDDRGQLISEAGPATPVEVLGMQGVPQAGETFQVVSDITRAQQISHQRQSVHRQQSLAATTKRGIEALGEAQVKELLVIVKADVQGSVEVLKSTLQKLSTERVKVRVVRSGVGAITESDVLLAAASQTEATGRAVVIIGFNVRPEVRAAELAKQEHVDVRLHSIIYKVEEEIRAAMIGMLDKISTEKILGKAEVLQTFKVPRAGMVAGCRVLDGIIRRNARARLIRDGVVAWEGGIGSLRRVKDDVSDVREGYECGISLENFNDVKVGDHIEAYVIEQVAATEL